MRAAKARDPAIAATAKASRLTVVRINTREDKDVDHEYLHHQPS